MKSFLSRSITVLSLLPVCGGLLLSSAQPADDVNLARAKGARAIGSGMDGPFLISKLNDGRLDTMGMWSSDRKDGVFCGIKLSEETVAFNTIRIHLFNGRAAFTGWRLEGTDDCWIDDDPDPGQNPGVATFYDPEVIAADLDGLFVNSGSKQHNVVTISVKRAKYKFVRLVFLKLPAGRAKTVGVPEMEIYNRGDNGAFRASLAAQAGITLDNSSDTITLAAPTPVGTLLARLSRPARVTVIACDATGKSLKDANLLTNGCTVLSKYQTGGNDAPFQTEYKCYAIVDTSAQAPPPKAPKPPHSAPIPKPPITVPSAPDAPKDTANLIIGKTIAGSIRAQSAATFVAIGGGNWFMEQRMPQWVSVDFGTGTEFNYISLVGMQVVHFRFQISDDETTWKDLVEVDRARSPWQWNGYFEKTKARHLRLVLLKPSWDVHLMKLVVANLKQPLDDKDGHIVQALKPSLKASQEIPGFPKKQETQ